MEWPLLTIAGGAVLTQPMVRLVLIAALCLVALPALAAQCRGNGIELKSSALCSIAFDFQGTCGKRVYDHAGWKGVVFATGAWEKSPIRIAIATADAMVTTAVGRAFAQLYAGNSFDADLMTPEVYAIGQPTVGRIARLLGFRRDSIAIAHAEEHFPKGLGMTLPTGGSMEDAHLDVHLTCFPDGATYVGSLTVWYVIDDPTNASAAAQ